LKLFEIRVHGLGGQGAVTLCTWVAQAGYAVDKHVQAFPFFGAERRGAPVKAFVRVDDEPIDLRSQVYHPDLLVVMSPDLTGLALSEGITPEGHLLVNTAAGLAERFAERFSRDVYYIDATGIALELGLEFDGMPMVNLPLLGAVTNQSGAAPLEAILELIGEVAAKRGNAEKYEAAVKRGWDGVEVVRAKAPAAEAPPETGEAGIDLSRSGVTPIEP
jgi:2-oxoacid:acceptor oxidoreductase gamma subunit (pyruvate/2-ketoisovalerate family)